MWPLTPLPVAMDVGTQLAALFVVSVIFVFAVFIALLGRLARRRRSIRTVTCPENRRRALVVLERWPDGAGYGIVVHCSRWHDGTLDCGQRCLDQAAVTPAPGNTPTTSACLP